MSYTDRALAFLAQRVPRPTSAESSCERSEQGERSAEGGAASAPSPVPPVVSASEADPPVRARVEARPVLLATATEVARARHALIGAQTLGFDLETAGRRHPDDALDPHAGRIRLIQLATPEAVYLIDCNRVDPRLLGPVFADGPVFAGHNLKFDLQFISAAGLPVPNGDRLIDTMLASQLLHAGTNGRHSLAAVAERELDVVLDKAAQASDWSGELTEEQIAYAARDAAILLPLAERLRKRLSREGLEAVMDLEMRALPAVAWLELTGAPFDAEQWRALAERAEADRDGAVAAIAELAPDLNPNSAPQIKARLADLGVVVPNVQEETLRSVQDRHPLIPLLLAHREAAKRAGTYGLGFLDHAHPATGRVHADYRQIGAATGRMSCSGPNLQNVPRDPAYRACFRSDAGRVLVKADYSQIELRIAAQLSGDAAMREAFQRGDDLHARTARAVLGREPNNGDRQLAKALNFGLVYGMGAETLREYARAGYGIDLADTEAEQFRKRFFAAYPGLRRWHRRQSGSPIATRTLTGRRRLNVEKFTEQLNTPVQGAGADVVKLALARLWQDRSAVPSAIPILAVHDEIVVEVDAAEAEAARAWLRGHMEEAGREVVPDVPIAVEARVVEDWSGAAAPGVKAAALKERPIGVTSL